MQRALDVAQRRLDQNDAPARLLCGDVTRLGELALGGRFDLVIDLKCFHGLPAESHAAYAVGVADACKPGATYLLFARTPSRGRAVFGAPRGVSRVVVVRLLQRDFEPLDTTEASAGPFTPNVYLMRRRGVAAA